jgi:glucuronate isomerase
MLTKQKLNKGNFPHELNSDEFISENFLLSNKTAVKFFHEFAKDLPIIDYHCHLPVSEIAADKKFKNLTDIWLYGDHYKWRAMRTNGIDEKYCTGDASDYEKFMSWAETVPHTLRNPLYHWTHMELKNPFGITDTLLNSQSASKIWEHCNTLLQRDDFSTRGLLKQFNVKVLCTTDDPTDSLEHHKKLREDNFEVTVLPAFRPDKGMAVEDLRMFKPWFEKLQSIINFDINSFAKFIEAIRIRHNFFHLNGCRTSDHGIETAYAEDYTAEEIEIIFQKIIISKELNKEEIIKFKSAMMFEFGVMDYEKNWVQQFHLGALRNVNTKMYNVLGPDTGFDSIGDFEIAIPLGRLLDKLNKADKLAKTIIYNLNPKDNEVIASMIGNFQDGSVAGKIQWGSAWWFLDQKDGIEKHINTLSNMGLLSRFIGMLTDSRSFLSFPRHEYFRRILCNIIGEDVEKGLIPNNEELISPLIQNVCYFNAKNYFNLS